MNNKRRIISFTLIISILTLFIPSIKAENDTVTISCVDDFVKFSKKCTLDTFSVGKKVRLISDIDFSETEFSPVPTFCGYFDGNGHTVSGIKFTKSGSYLGFFRHLQSGGRVIDLTVKGEFMPGGTKNFIGGIAGENGGIIENCSFDGKISGESIVGGIAGKNTDSGKIISCITSGSLISENSTGGIAGNNSGLIIDCTNDAQINMVYEEKKLDIKDIDVDTGAIVETYKTAREEMEEESILGHTDSGGITGYNSGILKGCTNNANVGYPHVGYNIGGIAGRQSGYILNCKNYGVIKGRKDVGGIVGQMEPYIMLDVSEISMKSIRDELGNLNRMVDHFIRDTEALDSDVERHLSQISKDSESARNNAETLLNQGTDFIDDNLDEINAKTAIISNYLDKIEATFGKLSSGSDDISDAINKIKTRLEGSENIDLWDSDNSDAINTALGNISSAERQLGKASEKARRGASELDSALYINDSVAVSAATSELSKAINEIIAAKTVINESLKVIEEILISAPGSVEITDETGKTVLDAITDIRKNTEDSISAFKKASKCLDTILLNTDIDLTEFKEGMEDLEMSLVYISEAMRYIAKSLDSLREISGINGISYDFSDALDSMIDAADKITDAMEDMSQIISDLSDEDEVTFVKTSEEFKTASDNLFDSLSGISDEIGKLRSSASGEKASIKNDVNAINDQFNVVMNLFIDEIEEFQSFSDISDIFLDVSDEDIENTKQGKVAECKNCGSVEADRNTGGIAGSLAIEYAKDPENEIEKPTSLNFTYRTKAILQECVNDGDIIGKKDCVGGVVGLSEIGIVFKCENYGNNESTSGNYVGGIAGKSESGIRRCYSKCRSSGNRFVGGIAGKAINLNSCYAIANVTGDESIGAIVGACDAPKKLSQNFYLDKGIGAIDGISYSKIAEPLTYEELCGISNMPQRMKKFTVSFKADDTVIETQEFSYNEETSKIRYPEIPEKEGFFGSWQSVDAETITEDITVLCEYSEYITVIASDEKDESGQIALALAEGKFTDKARLSVTDRKEKPYKKAHADAKVYDISVSNTTLNNSTITLRLLNENKKKVKAWRLDNGKWKRLSTSNRGKYVIMKMTDTSETICLQYANTNITLWLILVIIIVFILVLFILNRKKEIKIKI